MTEDTEFTKLPLEERCTHKLWKARLHGYSEAAKLFEDEEEEKAPIFNQFIGLVSKFVGDTNAAAQEKGLEAVLNFVQNAAVAGKTVKDVMSVIVAKCIAAPKAKTKELAVQIALMYVEIEKQEQVLEELVKGMEHKNPKIVAACASALALCLKEFGSKVISIKPIIKPLGSLLEDRDKNVRDETKALVVEIYRWIKDAIKPQLSSLKPIQLSELETEFEKVKGEKAAPTRFLRSQQVRQAKMAAEKDEADGEVSHENSVESEEVDPYEVMDPINVLGQIPGDFYEKLEAKKWQERKEAVDGLEKILDYPKYEKGDYSDLVRALLKVITKDSNVMVVGVAVKCLGRLALGLKKGFQPYANTVMPQLLEKFKEKKANVVGPLREAVDAVYPVTTLEAIQDDVIASLENKNPAVKAETASFLARCFTKCTPTILTKKILKALTTALLKTLNESDPTVRENSAEALGTAMKVVGEKAMSPLMPDIDNLKLSKIKECSEKAVVVKAAPVKEPKTVKEPKEPKEAKPPEEKPVRSKSDAAPQKPASAKSNAPKKASSVSKIKKSVPGSVAAKPSGKKKDEEIDTTPLLPVNNMKHQRVLDEQKLKTLKWNFTVPRSEFVDLLKEQMTTAGFNKNLVDNMFHSNFKLHLKAIDLLSDNLSNVDAVVSNLDLILKWMTLRFFDTNPSVLLKGLDYLQNVFASLMDNDYSVLDAEANSFMPYLVLKIGDPKDAVRDRVRAIIKQLSQMYPPGKIFTLVIEGLKSKNARQRTECLEELGNLIEEFGMSVCQPTPAAALKEISRQISDRDHSVRSAALNAIVKAWYIEGDKIYKLIGQISEKDLSLLEERVKRASKARPSLPPAVKHHEVKEKEKEKSPETKLNTTYEAPAPEEEEELEAPAPPPTVPTKHRPSAYDKIFIKDWVSPEPPVAKMDLIEIDDSFLNSPIQIPERIAAKLNRGSLPQASKPKEDSELDQAIRDLKSPNINVAFQAATKLRLVLESHLETLLVAYIDPIIDSLTVQLQHANSYSLEKYGLILPQTYRMLFRIIDDIFGKKTSLGVAVNVSHLQNLLQELLITLVEDKTAKFAEGGYSKWINVFVSRILEDSDHTKVTCAVVKMLHDVVGNPPENPKLTDLTTKCLLKIIVLIKKGNSTWCEGLDLDEVFYECHLFFQAYPRHTWKDRPSIVPLKAIKTLLLALVGIKGKDVFLYMTKIENPCASELTLYLRRLVKSQPASAKSAPSTRLSKAMSDHLSEIFMKIAYEETAKEGLLQFYEFKKQHPHLDLSSFLAPTSQYFRDYVETGLKNIERERDVLASSSPGKSAEPVPEDAGPDGSTGNHSSEPSSGSEMGPGLAQYYLDKLRMFQARVGYNPTELPDFKHE